MRVWKKDIVGKIKYRKGFIPLLYSNHAKERLRERVDGELIVAPTTIQIMDKNIYNGETKNGKRLTEICVRLDYKKDKWMFLAIVLNNGVVKSLWINDKYDRKTKEIRKEVGNVQEHLEKETPQKRSKWNPFRWIYKELFLRSCFTQSKIS